MHLPVDNITMKLPYLLHSEPAEIRLNRISRTARSCAPIALGPVLAGVRNDDLHVCVRLSDDFKLMDKQWSGDGKLPHYLCCHAPMP